MSLSDRLQGFVTSETSARPVALVRIAVAVAVLLELLTTGRALMILTDPGVIATPFAQFMPPITGLLALGLLAAWLVSGSAFLVGWHTRLSGVVLAAVLTLVLTADQQLYSNHLYLMILVVGLLVVADSGAALSIDARTRGERGIVPLWPLWLLRTQVSLVYGFSALAKLNLPFLSGSVIASSLRRDGLLAIPDAWRSAEPMLVLAILTILAEGFLAIALWVPRWRPLAFVTGLGLHMTITLWLSPPFQLVVFSVLMLPLYLLFLPVPKSRINVVWDDGCRFCGRWVRWFRRLDWLRTLEFVPLSRLGESSLPVTPDEATQALQAVTVKRVYIGYGAVALVASLLPVSFLWAPLLRIAPVAAIGERLYQRVARRRACAVPSTSSKQAVSADTGGGTP